MKKSYSPVLMIPSVVLTVWLFDFIVYALKPWAYIQISWRFRSREETAVLLLWICCWITSHQFMRAFFRLCRSVKRFLSAKRKGGSSTAADSAPISSLTPHS